MSALLLNPAFASVCFQNHLICRLPPRTLDLFLLHHGRSFRLCRRTQENTASCPRELCPVPGTRKPEDTGPEGKAFPVIVALRGPGFSSKPSAYLYPQEVSGVCRLPLPKAKTNARVSRISQWGQSTMPSELFPEIRTKKAFREISHQTWS